MKTIDDKIKAAQVFNPNIDLERVKRMYNMQLGNYRGLFSKYRNEKRKERVDNMLNHYLSLMTEGKYYEK